MIFSNFLRPFPPNFPLVNFLSRSRGKIPKVSALPMNLRQVSLPLVLAVAWAASPLHAEVKLPKVFTTHMVLQRDMAVPIYGTANPDETVTVAFRNQTKIAVAGKDGKWSVKLDPLKAGGPDTLTIGDKKIEDVLVGDVWVGSGQSNMDMATPSYHG